MLLAMFIVGLGAIVLGSEEVSLKELAFWCLLCAATLALPWLLPVVYGIGALEVLCAVTAPRW